MDSDNDIDLALANFSSNNISILTNNGDGTFDNAVNYATGNGSESVFGGDLDADEDIDLTVANWSGDNVSVLENLLQVSSIVPAEPFSYLLNNYPNPFSQSTVISYQLSESSKITLKIYNISGQEIRTLVNEKQIAGKHSVTWNGKDSNNKNVSSGIYLYKLSAGKETKIKKMLLLK